MKRFAIVLIILSLAGCTSIQRAYDVVTGTTISPTTVYVAANSFDTIEATATNYLHLQPCTTTSGPVCRNQAVAGKLVSIIRSGRVIRNQLENLISAGQGNAPVPATLYQALVALVTQAQQILAGVPQ